MNLLDWYRGIKSALTGQVALLTKQNTDLKTQNADLANQVANLKAQMIILMSRLARIGIPAQSGGSLLFQDDFKTGYSWGTLPVTSGSTIASTLASNWQFVSHDTERLSIEQAPWDASKNCFVINYVNSDDDGCCQHKFDPTHASGSSRPTELWLQWTEYRSSTFDFGPSKDWRIGIYRVNEYGGLGGSQICDFYGGFVNPTASGTQDCSEAVVNTQGYAADGNFSQSAAYVMPRATAVKIEIHCKVNTPDTADGVIEVFVDGVRKINVTSFKFTADGWGQGYIDFAQIGMTATNGGVAFADVSKRYATDVKISVTGYIG